MYTSNSKQQSRDLIKRLDLNTVPEIFLNNNEIDKMKNFLETYKEDLYIIRDAEHASSKYYYVHNLNECIEAAKQYNCRIILAVSINTYKNKTLLGAVEFKSNDSVKICATIDVTKDHRTMYDNLEFDYDTDIFDNKLSYIPEFDYLYQYVSTNKLYDLIIEFTIYDKNVGTKNERILINELRNY